MNGLTGFIIAITFFAVCFVLSFVNTKELVRWGKRKLRRKARTNEHPYSEPLGI